MARPKIKGPRKMTEPAGPHGESEAPDFTSRGKGVASTSAKHVVHKPGESGNRAGKKLRRKEY